MGRCIHERSLCEYCIESLRYCIKEKGLEIYAWVIMSNHLHLIIARKEDGNGLSEIVRDFKKFTASKIIAEIENNSRESRRNWMLWIFSSAGKKNKNNTNYQFWIQNNHAEQLITNNFIDQKLNYIHMNPVTAGLVDEPEYYKYSSATDYTGEKGLLPIKIVQ
jgi:putative transposase